VAGAVFAFRERAFTTLDYMRLTVLGGILFHILWEAKRLYSIPFMPFLFVLAIDGMFRLAECVERSERKPVTADLTDSGGQRKKQMSKHWLTYLTLLATVLMLVWCIGMGKRLTGQEREARYYTAAQLMEHCDIKRGLYIGESVRQEFAATKPFNTVGIQTRNYSWYYGAENESVYCMTITDSEDHVLAKQLIYGKDFEDYEFCDTQFETIVPRAGGELFRITIDTVYADDVSYLVFYKKTSDAIDPYPWGGYVENGVQMEQADLTFRVYQKEEKALMSQTQMFAFAGITILVQIAQIYLLYRLRKREIQSI
jgi:hypothetical protein